ncbi:tail fiber domain-containing protein [Ferruginibacter sp. SUN002]|uniref:tail fiber domain-containing protein n=1 Tax=Ferruginibacter sp. SUN002 TaxID=2937789 RepID=UPI003D36BA64
MRYLLLFVSTLFAHFAIAQNVGIGTALPNKAKLEVSGAIGNTVAIFTQAQGFPGVTFFRTPPAIGFNLYTTDQNRYVGSGSAMVQYINPANGGLYFDLIRTKGSANQPATAISRSMTIQQNGNVALSSYEQDATLFVGIGATLGDTLPTRFVGTTYNTIFNQKQSTTVYNSYLNGGKAGSDVYVNDVNFGNVYLCKSFGNVSVNTTSANATLTIKQYGGHGLVLVEPSTFHNWEFVTTKNLTDAASDYYLYYNGAYRGNIFYIDGGYYPISDKRLKKDVRSLSSVLSKVLSMNPVTYKMKYGSITDTKTLGFIAQEVNNIFPELTQQITSKDTEIGYPGLDDLYTMHYDGMAPIVIKAIQEQQEKIKSMQSKNDELRKRINAIESIVNDGKKF